MDKLVNVVPGNCGLGRTTSWICSDNALQIVSTQVYLFTVNLQIHGHAVVVYTWQTHRYGLVFGDLAEVNAFFCDGIFPAIVARVVCSWYQFTCDCYYRSHRFTFYRTLVVTCSCCFYFNVFTYIGSNKFISLFCCSANVGICAIFIFAIASHPLI